MKKGFTLIEMLGVLVVLGIILLITVPTVNSVIKSGKQSALDETINRLESAAYTYSSKNNLGYYNKTHILEIESLKESGLIGKETIINPVTDSELTGCIFYRWDDNFKQYQFNYDEDCEIKDLDVNITNYTGKFDEAGWANQDFYVKIETTGSSYNYCISEEKCTPNVTVNDSNGTAYVTIESENIYVCAYAIDGNITSEIVCSDAYKLDKSMQH